MAPECRFILPTGQKCRCAATRNQDFCRHHAPIPATPAQRPLPKHLRYSRLRRWINLGRDIPFLETSSVPYEIFEILLALLEDGEAGISDREAGRLIRGLLRRIGAVPFSIPGSGPDPNAQQPQPPAPPELFNQMLASLEREVFGHTQPSLNQTQPSPHQTRPFVNQPQPSRIMTSHPSSTANPAVVASPTAARESNAAGFHLTSFLKDGLLSTLSTTANPMKTSHRSETRALHHEEREIP